MPRRALCPTMGIYRLLFHQIAPCGICALDERDFTASRQHFYQFLSSNGICNMGARLDVLPLVGVVLGCKGTADLIAMLFDALFEMGGYPCIEYVVILVGQDIDIRLFHTFGIRLIPIVASLRGMTFILFILFYVIPRRALCSTKGIYHLHTPILHFEF